MMWISSFCGHYFLGLSFSKILKFVWESSIVCGVLSVCWIFLDQAWAKGAQGSLPTDGDHALLTALTLMLLTLHCLKCHSRNPSTVNLTLSSAKACVCLGFVPGPSHPILSFSSLLACHSQSLFDSSLGADKLCLEWQNSSGQSGDQSPAGPLIPQI